MSPNAFRSIVEIDLLGCCHMLRAAYRLLRKPGVRVRIRLGGGAGGAECSAASARGRRDRRVFAGATGAHYPSDVVIGAVVGNLYGAAVQRRATHRAAARQM
jgi:hypothetical protein